MAGRAALFLCSAIALAAACSTEVGGLGAAMTFADAGVVTAERDASLVVPPEDAGVPDAMPVVVSFVSVAAGGAHTCALASDGAVTCWGANSAQCTGRLTAPEETTFTAISTADDHACGVRAADGREVCWGWIARGL